MAINKPGPTHATPAQLAVLFKATPAGKKISKKKIMGDIQDGAPLQPGGKILLIDYLVWLLRQHGYKAEKD